MNNIRLVRNCYVKHDAMKTYGDAETAPLILFYVSWFIELACNKKPRNNVEVSGYGHIRGADTEFTWTA